METKLFNQQHPFHQPLFTRREFLALSGGALARYAAAPLYKLHFTTNRADKWAPDSNVLTLIQWRHVVGRILDGDDDYGFIVSISDITTPPTSQQLLVQRQSLNGDQAFAYQVYAGTREYDIPSATYTFKDGDNQTLATWNWNETDQQYELTVTTTELTLSDVLLKPQGDLIAEGGDGEIQAGRIKGVLIDSDYHADWASIEIGEQEKGIARIDMQGLRPAGPPQPETRKYAHNWFAIAVELSDETLAWISAWRIEALEGPYWTVTIAQGSGETWTIERSLTEGDLTTPLAVQVLEWQDIPDTGPAPKQAGRKWRLTAPDGSLNLDVAVPPGQFIIGNPLAGLSDLPQMQEAVGIEATGTVLGKSIATVRLVSVESTFEFDRSFLPAIFR